MIGKQTIKKYCCEDISLIENFDIAVNSPDKWDCHHRKEIENGRIISVKELKEQGLYYNRPAEELIFLSKAEHQRLHVHNCSEETRKKMSESHKGKKHSEETRKKIAEAKKGHECSAETRKKMAEAHKGKSSGTKGKHRKLVDGEWVWY